MESQGQQQVIRLHGDLGLVDRDRIEGLLPAPETVERLVLDCTDVGSMDSSILALIMIYRRRLQIAGRDPLASFVAIAPTRIFRLFELTGITRAITVLPAPEPSDEKE